MRRVGSAIQIRFKPGSGATHQIVSVRLSNGMARPYVLGPRASRLTIGPLPRKVRALSVTIVGSDAGLFGPRAHA